MAAQVADVVGLLLPDPQQLVHRRLEVLPADGEDGKLLSQVIAVDHPEELDGVGGGPVLPPGADRPVGVPYPFGQNIFAVPDKNLDAVSFFWTGAGGVFLPALYHKAGPGTRAYPARLGLNSFVLAPGGQAAPDMALGLVLLQHPFHL